jgi:hypothetical protein
MLSGELAFCSDMRVEYMEMAMPSRSPATVREHVYMLASFIPLCCSSLLSTWLGYYYSMDMKGLWPLTLGVSIFATCLYAATTAFLASVTGVYQVKFSAWLHTLLAVASFVHAYLFYTMDIDWLAVNTGRASLDKFERFVYSHWTPWAIYILGFMVLVAVSVSKRKKK